jgi:hypothetical protein
MIGGQDARAPVHFVQVVETNREKTAFPGSFEKASHIYFLLSNSSEKRNVNHRET